MSATTGTLRAEKYLRDDLFLEERRAVRVSCVVFAKWVQSDRLVNDLVVEYMAPRSLLDPSAV